MTDHIGDANKMVTCPRCKKSVPLDDIHTCNPKPNKTNA